MERKGQNPFDRTNLPKGQQPLRTEKDAILWERIRAAQNVASKQKERTELALAAPVVPPKVVPRPQKPAVASPSAIEVPSLSEIRWTGSNVWRVLCFAVWIFLSLCAFAGSFAGGVIISMGLFFVTVFVSNLPFYLGGAFMDGGRNNNGKAV